MAELKWAAATDPGLSRDQNEDHYLAIDGVFAVADGMGGHLAGEVASEITVNLIAERLGAPDLANVDDDPIDDQAESTDDPSESTDDDTSSDTPDEPAVNTLDTLTTVISDANTTIIASANTNPQRAGMGTTVTALAVVDDPIDGEVFGVANVGDSRIYVMRHNRLRQVTIDHSFVQELVAEGAITRDEARFHPRRNIVTRALGVESYVRIDSWTMPIIRGDRFVLCSDGLSDYATDDEIAECLLAHPDDPDAAAHACVDAANRGGGGDNITVVIVDVLDGDTPPDPTEEIDIVPLWDDDDAPPSGEHQIVADPIVDDDLPPNDDDTPAPLPQPETPPRRSRTIRPLRFLAIIVLTGLILAGGALLTARARTGYYIGFDQDDTVTVFQGRNLLWFSPTAEAPVGVTRSQLDQASIALVEEHRRFDSFNTATEFAATIVPTTTTTTTTTTTVAPAPPTATTPPTTTGN